MSTRKLPQVTSPELLNGATADYGSWHAFEIMAEFVGATEKLKKSRPQCLFLAAHAPSQTTHILS